MGVSRSPSKSTTVEILSLYLTVLEGFLFKDIYNSRNFKSLFDTWPQNGWAGSTTVEILSLYLTVTSARYSYLSTTVEILSLYLT